MPYLPIFLDVTSRKCVVVGGGEVAARRAEALLEAGAAVTVISPRLSPELEALAARKLIVHTPRNYQSGDINGCAIVYAATDDPKLHRDLAAEARALGIPINVADVPELCTFIAPAVVRRGALQVAISTSGASPAFAVRMRRTLEKHFGAEYAIILEVLRAARRFVRACEIEPAERMRRLSGLANSALPDAIAAGDIESIDRLLAAHLGDGIGLAQLGIDPSSVAASVAPVSLH
jgi:precorrin-2 dehydrogenase / sirohydrochlorin ferrochelatase